VDVTWEPFADRLLQQRDRFTEKAIRGEFEAAAQQPESLARPSIEFDETRKGYLTPVADGRYSVVWYLEHGEAVVRAVVPTTRFSRAMDDLKARVRRIVQQESNGAVDVK
jgi:hypothetical protein